MPKKRTSVSMTEATYEALQKRDDINVSGLFEQFVTEFLASGQSTEAALAVRKEQLEADLDEAKGEVRRIEDELERVEAELKERRDRRRDTFEAFHDLGVRHDLTTDNPAVKNHAERCGMSPGEFLAQYQEWVG